ncbi:hypothetical protein C9J85_02855 [Haloferax sp. wsp5]|nr:hypothetical protein C9J85_02855 [Haloferax sp. wsp5]
MTAALDPLANTDGPARTESERGRPSTEALQEEQRPWTRSPTPKGGEGGDNGGGTEQERAKQRAPETAATTSPQMPGRRRRRPHRNRETPL